MYPKQLTFFPKYNTVFTFFLCYTSVLQISSSYFQSPWMHTRNGCMAFSVWPSCWWRVAHAYVMLGKLSTSSLCWMPKWQGYNTEAQLEDRDMMSPCNRKCLKNGLQAGITSFFLVSRPRPLMSSLPGVFRTGGGAFSAKHILLPACLS